MGIYQAKFTAFIYRWNQKSTGKWYIGSRTAKGCHVNDGYTCSSKTVKPLIESNPEGWSREILVMGESKFMIQVEAEILQELDAKNDPDSYNMHNGDGKWSMTGTTGTTGMTGRKHSPESRARMSESHQNSTPEQKAAHSARMSDYNRNRTTEQTAAHRTRVSASHQNRTPEQQADWCARISTYHQNRTPEQKADRGARISTSHKNRTPEQKAARRAKISASHQNRTPEQKAEHSARLSEAQLGKPKPKVVCHIETRKEYSRSHWSRYFPD